MTQQKLRKILEKHKLWLLGRGGAKADLSEADLSEADLSEADLSEADLFGANLSKANLSEANLSEANLSGADLSEANLSGADLFRADLFRADLFRANLSGANYNLLDVLRLNIVNSSDDLALELMRWDATICGAKVMSTWAKGGSCPFSTNISRLFNFRENRTLWKPGKPTASLLELWQWIARENKIKI